jgi:hypothetical protein
LLRDVYFTIKEVVPTIAETVSDRIANEAVRNGVKEKRFKNGEQWEVLRREEGAAIVTKDGVEKQLPLD